MSVTYRDLSAKTSSPEARSGLSVQSSPTEQTRQRIETLAENLCGQCQVLSDRLATVLEPPVVKEKTSPPRPEGNPSTPQHGWLLRLEGLLDAMRANLDDLLERIET